jgi:hypothetical protein
VCLKLEDGVVIVDGIHADPRAAILSEALYRRHDEAVGAALVDLMNAVLVIT